MSSPYYQHTPASAYLQGRVSGETEKPEQGRAASSPKCHKCCILLLGLLIYVTGVKMVESSTTGTSHEGKSYNCPANVRNTGPPAVSRICALADAEEGPLP